jgi:uncharacterized circularly permuted ATP-grasp superfamily protein
VRRAVQCRGVTPEASDPFDGYRDAVPQAGAFDEMFDAEGAVRAPYRAVGGAAAPAAVTDLEARAEALRRAHDERRASLRQGVGALPPDVVPRVISAQEWSGLQQGIAQRVRALEAFLADVHGAAEIVGDGVLPRRLITGCRGFHRAAHGLVPRNGVRIHVAGFDLLRDGEGAFRVLAAQLRNPSGVSRVLANRAAMARTLPGPAPWHRIRPVDDHAGHLLRALRAAAGRPDPTVVVLTAGGSDPAHAEHRLLARLLGAELVEGRDLYCRDNAVHLRTPRGERRVDVIHRRIDDEFLDPLQFDPDSTLGVAGMLNAARAGNVVIANAVGNGVGDDGLVHTYVPQMIDYYLGERPLLPDVATFRCWLDEERAHVLAHLGELVLEPVGDAGGHGVLFGPNASGRRLASVRRAIREDPRGWVARPVVPVSTVPTRVGDRLVPRPVELRSFAVNDGNEVTVLPGGLTRVGPAGVSKDTWVLAPGPGPVPGGR